ncbi:regulatory protein GemA [Hoeflea sp. WL0058]|uniref:Regulatory protein GemA n=1 Tax=Flavimaribacter sediminis TaxID=2865987 RepID=A0AAE2ZQD6_9HYPH|nr:regulatory protein GemA [Flavimaribacter sediminis]MBW8638971.1 regulatory protein GemA [Flavimaribacter sediminis]
MTALAKIHVAKKQLGLDDDSYRDVLERTVGHRTAKGLTEAQCGKVLEEMNRLGFKSSSGALRKALEGRFAKKLQALWIAGWNLGIVRNRDDHALLAFVKRQTGLDHTRFLHHPEDAAKAIEALKAWLARDGGVDWGKWKDWEPDNGCRIAMAQCLRLDSENGARDFWPTVCKAGGISAPNQFKSERDWQAAMNELGRRIRAAEKAA